MADRKSDLNVRGALSAHGGGRRRFRSGVALAGAGMLFTGWRWLDPVVSLAIVATIFVGTWGLLRDSVKLASKTTVEARAAKKRKVLIEPTVGSFAPTAQLHGFRSTLTTAHNPGLTAPPAAMSTSHGDQLSVMRLISEPVPESRPAQAAPASVPRSRRWSPRLPVQLTPVDSAPTPVRYVQALSAPSAPNGDIESGSGSDAFTSSLVRAADPQEQREVPVVSFTSEGPATASAQSVDSGSGSDAFTSSPVHAADPHVQREVPVETSTSELPATASTQSVDSAPAPMLSPARRYMQPTRTYSGQVPVETSTSELPATASTQSVDSGSSSDAFTSSPVHAADPHVQRAVPVETSTSELPATASTHSIDSGSSSDAFTSSPVHAADPHVQRAVPVETSTSELPATASTQSVDPPHAGQSETVEPTPTSETVSPPTTPAALPTVTISRIADDTPPPTRTVARIPDGQRDPAAVASPRQPATNDALPPTTTTSPVATPLQRATESADLPRTHEIVAEPETAFGVVEQTGSFEADPHRPDMAGSSHHSRPNPPHRSRCRRMSSPTPRPGRTYASRLTS